MSALLLPLASFVLGSAAAAQPAPSLPELRSALASMEEHRPAGIAEGTLTSIDYLLDISERIDGSFSAQSARYRTQAARFLEQVRAGHEPYPDQRGILCNRGYRSALSTITQGYAIYIPPTYDPSRSYPLMVALHGGSSNGNLFLGVVLGNNMDWERYGQFLWNEFRPLWSPDWIVVAPDGFGQVMWRWMGEQDVLDVIADVKRHYNVDHDRVVLGGLSNGGVGAYSIGTRHASEFSVVQAMAAAPSWIQYTRMAMRPEERIALVRVSALDLIENSLNTDFRYYHGRQDEGPMRPAFVEELTRRVRELQLPARGAFFDLGHDILYAVHRHGRVYDQLAEVRRNRRPSEVRVVTGDYRANRQHWVTVTRIDRYPALARVRAVVDQGGAALAVETDNTVGIAIELRDAPLTTDISRITIDGTVIYDGPRAHLGHVVNAVKSAAGWHLGFPDERPGTLVKHPGLGGPLTDAYFGSMIHVYGTQNADHTDALRSAAEQGSRGWPLWLWNFRQPVVADTDVTSEMMRSATVVLYGSDGDNSVLERIESQLPIRIERDAVVVGEQRFAGRDVGVRFIYPNPLAPDSYVMVQGAVQPSGVVAGRNLPDFLPDYLVYDGRTTRNRARLVTGPNRALAMGYFDRHWQLAPVGSGADDTTAPDAPSFDGGMPDVPLLPIPEAPPLPRTRTFLAPETDPAGAIAREIAIRARAFKNFRAEIPGATWTVDRRARWSIRSQADCYEDLRAQGIAARPAAPQPTPVPAPVELLGPVGGVWFRSTHEDRPLVVACELAARLPALAEILTRHGVHGVDVMSSYRTEPTVSFHTMGMALDMARFWTDHGWMSVEHDFEATPASETCAAPTPQTSHGRRLLRIACDLARSRRFSSILTPNYNEGHRDHFHIDIRPDDPRVFVR